MKNERRSLNATLTAAPDSKFQIVGTAAAYNTLSADLGGFKETIKPGAFTRTLKSNPDVKCLLNHNPNTVLGRTRSGTLTLADSRNGLRFLCQLDASSQGHRDLYASVKRGDISECSFAFAVNANGEEWDQVQEGRSVYPRRTLTDVNLFDVSIVTNPAYPTGTTVAVRSVQYRRAARPRTEAEMLQIMDEFHRARAKYQGLMIRLAQATESANEHMRAEIHQQQCARAERQLNEIRRQREADVSFLPATEDEIRAMAVNTAERERMVH
jgi:HK97 family phage prohead protease